ncbi:MAG: histidinol-phosphatase, partial [Muribaculaceae bacterium]|nr:histidinol-phosphatase [Muribaculaceae bacterium]
LGHFDKVAQNASSCEEDLEQLGWYNDLLDNYIRQIISSGVIVEINTKARETSGRFFPHERYWKRLIDGGVAIAVNSDAHYFSRISSGRSEAFEILKKLGYEAC